MANDHRISNPDLTVVFLPRKTMRVQPREVTPPRMKSGGILSPVMGGTRKETPDERRRRGMRDRLGFRQD